MMKCFKNILFILILFTATAVSNQSDNNPRYPPDIEQRIERIINNLQVKTDVEGVYESKTLSERLKYYHTPGLSIAVINDGKIEWARGFGVRDENNDPVDINTLFMAASISKPVFALAVMRLRDKGIVDLDKDVNEYLTSWKVTSANGIEPKITLRQLLSHTAGVTVHGFAGYLTTDPIPTIEQILSGEPPANNPPVIVDILPSTTYRYAGGGTMIAQLTIMDILGKPFPEIMIEEIFEPLNLKLSTFNQPLPETLDSNVSTGFPNSGIPVKGKFHVYPEMAAAGLWTTPSEIAEILIEVQKAIRNESEVFKRGTIEEMLTPQKVARKIGIGFLLQNNGNSESFTHNGWNEGFVSLAVASKTSGTGAVIMINSNEGHPLRDEIIRSIAAEYQWPGYTTANPKTVKTDTEMIRNAEGKYFDKDNNEISITVSGNSLYLIFTNTDPLPLVSKDDGRFWNEQYNFSIKFENDKLILSQHQSRIVYVRRTQ